MPLLGSFPSTGNVALEDAICTAAESVGDAVFISGAPVGGIKSVAKVDITDRTKMPAVAVIVEKPTTTTCVIQKIGDTIVVLPFTFTVTKRVYATNSGLSSTIPSNPADFIQIVGIASATNILDVGIYPPVRLAP